MNADELAIYCADIGCIKNDNFGRAVVHGEEERGGKEIGELVADVVVSLSAGSREALGFECSPWVPVPEDPLGLPAGRAVVGNKPWSAGAGASEMAAGLTETAWILREIRRGMNDRGASLPSMRWTGRSLPALTPGPLGSVRVGRAKATGAQADEGGDVADVLPACKDFAARLPDLAAGIAWEPWYAVRSLIGSAVVCSAGRRMLT